MKIKRSVPSASTRVRPVSVKKHAPKPSVRQRPTPKPMSNTDMRRRMGY